MYAPALTSFPRFRQNGGSPTSLEYAPQEKETSRRWPARARCQDEYLLYQTLLGVWPLTAMTADEYTVFKQRMQDYMRKAVKGGQGQYELD